MSSLVPDGWSEEYISEYFNFSIGGTPSRNNELYWDAKQTTSNIWVSIKDLNDKFISNSAERISDLGVLKSNVKLLPKNTVLMSFKLSIGRLAISTTPLYTNEAIVGFIEKRPNTVDRDYLYYGLQSWNLLGEVDQAVKGATLNKDKMSRILGVFPPLPEQKKIASILTSVDEVIENTQKQIDKLQDLKKATMNELLTKGIGHTEFKDSELGRIPKSWEVVTLNDICDLQVGYAFKSTWFTQSGIALLRGENVGYGDAKWDVSRYLDNDRANEFSQYLLTEGDIVIGMDRTFTKSGSKITRISSKDLPCLLVQRVGRFRSENLGSDFLWQLLRSEPYLNQLVANEKGMDIPHLSKQEILEPIVPLIPIGEQIQISSILKSFDEQSQILLTRRAQTQSLKKSLMQDLLTGKVRVTVD